MPQVCIAEEDKETENVVPPFQPDGSEIGNNYADAYINEWWGRVAEWTKAPVLKTGVPQGTVGSNPTPSANRVYV